ncbi:DUF928 domain-containing protein [Microseira wollei]|uniref:DUF928 domain-containing protein n=1 Tax=Microseira wollei NIES-4236 TaxID=2530354 RepID=A0AAV3XEH4_9CYAN|nr:DUF928 domain-containing protein [Microseira wollei]GET40744.1 hypothetical protein MiSe_55550 [Microseira wollei NIES-4236]
MSDRQLLSSQISLNLFLALTIVQPLSIGAKSQNNQLLLPGTGRMPIPQEKSTLEYNPPQRGAPGDRKDAGTYNHPPLPTRLEYDPPQRGAPDERSDAGSRGSEDLLALVPVNQYGWTTAEYPTFWFYLKRQTSSTSTIKLELIDEHHKVVYQITLALTQREGIMHITLPKTAPRLEIGKQYQWVLSSGEMGNEMHAGGWIERVALTPELASQLQQAKPRERVLIFAKNGFWYETITELAALRRANPQDTQLADDWVALLQDPDVSLTEIISQLLVPCCTP